MRVQSIICSLIFCFLAVASAFGEEQLEIIRKKQKIDCAVNNEGYGFAYPDDAGKSRGMAVDLCKALAVALFNDKGKANLFHIVSRDQVAFTVNGNYDVLIRTFEWTLYRDTMLGLTFTNPWFYDTQKIAVHKDSNIKELKDLNNATICMSQGNNTEQGITELFRKNNLRYQPLAFATPDDAIAAFDARRCDAYTTDHFLMIGNLTKVFNHSNNFEILDIDFNNKVYGIAIRKGSYEWENIVKWVINTLIYAEEQGINSNNVDSIYRTTNDPIIRKILNIDRDFGKRLGLRDTWAVDMIRSVGNYGEIYDRNFRRDLKNIKWPARSLNNLCKDGGKICPVAIY